MADDDEFSADPAAVARGAEKMKHVLATVKQISTTLKLAVNAVDVTQGNDDFTKALTTNYLPGARNAQLFLTGVGELIEGHGDQTGDLAHLLDNVNVDTSTIAGHGKTH